MRRNRRKWQIEFEMEVKEEGEAMQMQRPLINDQSGSSPSTIFSSVIMMVVVSTAVAVSGSLVFGLAVGYSSPSQSEIMQDLGLSLPQYSLFGSILTIGAMFGAILSGRIADLLGRRCAMGVSDAFCLIGWTSIFLAKDIWFLDLGRFLVGCGIGLLSYVVPVYIAEITPKNLRGGFAALNQLMICCGASIAYVLGTVFTWRSLAVFGNIPCFIQLVGLFFIPESPRWLAKVSKHDQFQEALQRLRGKHNDISQEVEEIKEFTDSILLLPQSNMLDLFQAKYLHAVIVSWCGAYGMIAMAAVQVPMTVLGVLLMDKSGRRPLLIVSAAGTCIGCVSVAMSFLIKGYKFSELSTMLALSGLLVYTGSFSLGMGAIPWVIMSEIFPVNMKGTAGSLVTLVSWFGSWIISYTFNFLMIWSSAGTFWIFASICGLTMLFVDRMVPETKGRTLEEIHASMTLILPEKNTNNVTIDLL